MKNIEKSISPAVKLNRLFNQECCSFNRLVEIDKNVAEKNRELFDDFKSINDTYGHIIGDKLLKEVASVLESLCRSEDVLVRFGGDEFVVLMSDTCASEAVIFSERIRKKIAGHFFFYEDIKISVSVSLGASTFNQDDFQHVNDPEELISMADRAMYRVKQKGKNNTCHLPFCLTPSGAMGKNLPISENLLR